MSRLLFLFAFIFLRVPSFAAIFGSVVTDLGATDIALDEPRGRLYIVNSSLNRVDVWNTKTRAFMKSIAVGTQPLAGAMTFDGKLLYVTSYAQVALDVIDLNTDAVIKRVALPASPEGVAVGLDGRVLISTIGTGANNSSNTLLLYDPNASASAQLSNLLISVGAPGVPVTPPLGLTPLSVRSALRATSDGTTIIGVHNITNTTRTVFVYQVSSATVLKARTVTNVSNVLSISPDGSKFMAGLTLFETATLTVLAQQNAANAPFSFPSSNATNFNTQQNQGGSVFSPDSTAIYSAFNISPIQNPPAKADVSRLLIDDSDNLLINLGLQLPENLAGKMVVTSDGATVYALAESGFVTLPVSNIFKSPIVVPTAPNAFLANDQCGVSTNKQTTIPVNNLGTGKATVTAQLLSLPAPATGGLGGFGGPGGGGPGGAIVILLPPALLGIGAPGGVTAANGFGSANTTVLQTSPLVQNQQTGTGSNITFGYNPINAKNPGTITPHNFLIQSAEAINIPGNVQIFQNNHDSNARAQVMPLPVNASTAEGLFDLTVDRARQRIYIANSGMNRVEVFDMVAQQFLTPIKVGQLPHSLAIGTDGSTLYVANSGSETISVVDLDAGKQTGLIRFTPLPFNASVSLVTPSVIAAGLQGPQVVMSDGSLWRVVGDQVLPRTLNPVVFGTSKTISGPNQTMASTPGGEFIFLLGGNGTGYLYDSMVDNWVASRPLFTTNTNTSTLPGISGYYGPVAAGPGGDYFLANGVIYNSSLTETGVIPTPATVGVVGAQPTRGATTVSAPPVAAVAAMNDTTFIRFTQPTPTTAGQTSTSPFTVPTIEVVDVASGNTMQTGAALEGPMAQVTGNQVQRVGGRTLAASPDGTTAYALTTSGLSIIPLTPVPASAQPVLSRNGIVSTANQQAAVAPGSLVSVLGQNMAADGTASTGSNLPTILGGSCVTLNNVPLPLIMTSSGQINAQIPPTVAAGSYPLVVRSIANLAASSASTVKVAKVAPAVFIDENGNAAIYDSNGKLVTKDNPASRDQHYKIYATGLGVTKGGKVTAGAPAPSSPLAVTDTVAVYFGNPLLKQSQVIVNWSGLMPGAIGVNEIDITVPGNHNKGNAVPVTLKIDGVSSPATGPGAPVVAVN